MLCSVGGMQFACCQAEPQHSVEPAAAAADAIPIAECFSRTPALLPWQALQLDWRLGAELFASLLVDHDWTLNSTNWAYNSGVGSDPRDRVFRTVSQGQRCVWGWVGNWGIHCAALYLAAL